MASVWDNVHKGFNILNDYSPWGHCTTHTQRDSLDLLCAIPQLGNEDTKRITNTSGFDIWNPGLIPKLVAELLKASSSEPSVWKHQSQGANEFLTRAHLDWEVLGCHTHTGSAFCIEVLLCWVHIYLQLLHLPGLILQSICSAIVSCNNLYFQVNFVWISISLILF